MKPGDVIEWRPYSGNCPSCGGPVKVVQATFFDLPAPPPGKCVYSRWRRDGIDEDGGICRSTNGKHRASGPMLSNRRPA